MGFPKKPHTPVRFVTTIYANLLGLFLRKVKKSEQEIVMQEKELNTGLSTEVQ